MKRILIVKTSAIGDVLQALPVLSYLRQLYPHTPIDWVVEQPGASLLQAHPDVDQVCVIRSKQWRRSPFSFETIRSIYKAYRILRSSRYDLIIDLQGNWKSGLLTLCARGKVKLGFDAQGVREKGNLLATNHRLALPSHLSARERYLELVQRYLGQKIIDFVPEVHLKLTDEESCRLRNLKQGSLWTKKTKLMICFGSNWKNKQLKKTQLVTFLDQVVSLYDPTFLFVFGTSQEEKEAQELYDRFVGRSLVVGGMSLPFWQAVMWNVDLVFAVDSAALHLCATTATPSLSVFGPSLATAYKPPGEQHRHLQGRCPYGREFSARCPILRSCSTAACMDDLKIEELLQMLQQALHSI